MRFETKFWVWLVETQLDEITIINVSDTSANKNMRMAHEFADIIGISLQAIQELMGGDKVKPLIKARLIRNIERIPRIAYKYRKKWIHYEEAHKNDPAPEV